MKRLHLLLCLGLTSLCASVCTGWRRADTSGRRFEAGLDEPDATSGFADLSNRRVYSQSRRGLSH